MKANVEQLLNALKDEGNNVSVTTDSGVVTMSKMGIMAALWHMEQNNEVSILIVENDDPGGCPYIPGSSCYP